MRARTLIQALGETPCGEVAKHHTDEARAGDFHARLAQLFQQSGLIVRAVDIPRCGAFEVTPPMPSSFDVKSAEFPCLPVQLEPQREEGAGQPESLAIIEHAGN